MNTATVSKSEKLTTADRLRKRIGDEFFISVGGCRGKLLAISHDGTTAYIRSYVSGKTSTSIYNLREVDEKK